MKKADLRDSAFTISQLLGVIHKPCGQSRGRRVSEKTMFVHMGGGEGGVRGLSTWAKRVYGYPFSAHEFKCPFGVIV